MPPQFSVWLACSLLLQVEVEAEARAAGATAAGEPPAARAPPFDAAARPLTARPLWLTPRCRHCYCRWRRRTLGWLTKIGKSLVPNTIFCKVNRIKSLNYYTLLLVGDNDGGFQLNKKALKAVRHTPRIYYFIPPPSAAWCRRSAGGAQWAESQVHTVAIR